MKRIAVVLSFFWILAFIASASPMAADETPARHTCQVACCTDGCTCCEGGACTCADAACACCKDGACQSGTCEKKCGHGEKKCEKACKKMSQEKK